MACSTSIPSPLDLDFDHFGFSDALPHAKIGTLRIAGVLFYVEAVEVRGSSREDSMTAVNPAFQDRIDAVAHVDAGGERPGYQVIAHGEDFYFLLIYPYQR